ncbi:MAG: DUF1330 domain-containing protein [Candidatus Zixiibacteriota bacterium]|nr:MAG: DUF1330 domain-containing protein [candidate division Zixibacteria bacterium]
MACYFLAEIDVHDAEEYQSYLDGYDTVFDKFKGEVIAVDEDPVLLEGEWPYTRTVLIKFPDEAEARRWYDSPQYRQLVKHRHRASNANVILIKGRK